MKSPLVEDACKSDLLPQMMTVLGSRPRVGRVSLCSPRGGERTGLIGPLVTRRRERGGYTRRGQDPKAEGKGRLMGSNS